MKELLKTLNNIRALRNLTRKLTIEQLESIIAKLQFIINEKREAAEKYQYQEQQRKERIEKYKSLLKQDGITADELAEILGDKQIQPRKKRQARPAKYKYTDENGEVKTWTGQGRTPKAIQKALDEGKSLDSFAI